jgi:YidC/Oxa1 family membrane protein insertase
MMLLGSPLQPLEDLLRNLLDWLHGTVGLPWAWAIVATTVIVRFILVPLTVRQIHSMQNLQRFAPQMKEIQKKYKSDKQKQNEELMKFYRENSINPAASCLPMLLQFPVFIALYYVLNNFSKHPPGGAAAVAHGDFSWLHFIPSIADPTTKHWGGFVLLVIYVASQMASTLYMSATVDKLQRTIFMLMPLVFVFVIAHFPAGLVLYWVTTNLWTVGQGLITRKLVPKTPAPSLFGERRSSRTPPKDDGGDSGGDGGGNGAKRSPDSPKPAPSQSSRPAQPRKVRRKKKAGRR